MSGQDAELVDIWITDTGPRPIAIYKRVDHLSNLNLKQVRKLVDAAPAAVLSRVPQAQAAALKGRVRGDLRDRGVAAGRAAGAPTDLT
jgi:ribosomal protein L7/L12